MDLGNLPEVVRTKVVNFDIIPDQAKIILSLRLAGMGATRIARITGLTKPNVESYLKRYDPDNDCMVSNEVKRVITTEMLMNNGIIALAEITEAKLIATDAKGLASIATKCITAAERIRALDKGLKIKEATRIDSLMDSLENAEIIEE